MINLLSWNCRSLCSKLSRFKIKLYTLKPHIVCLCETWLKQSYLPSFINYFPYYVHRKDKNGGGIAILVRNDVSCKNKELILFPNGELEVQAVTVHSDREILDILNVYNPNCNISTNEFSHYFKQLSNKCIVVGDFNAHSRLWDTRSTTNISGNNLVNSLIHFPSICLITPLNFPTYYHVQTRKTSTLDLCFVSNKIMGMSSIDIMEDLGSDHGIISININFEPQLTPMLVRPRWKFDRENGWVKWIRALPPVEKSDRTYECYQVFVSNIVETTKGIFNKTKPIKNPKFCKPWWNEECRKAVHDSHHAKNLFKKKPTMSNLINMRKTEAIAKKVCKKAKKESFKKFCNKINSETPSAIIWKSIHQLANCYVPKNNVPFVYNNKILTTPLEKVNLLADIFEAAFNINDSLDGGPFLLEIALALTDESESQLNGMITACELRNCVATLKSTSPGEDYIHNDMIKNLPDEYMEWLLNIINHSFLHSVLDHSWKKALIIALPKANKESTDPLSKRPISLLSCISKICEKVINYRLYHYMESNRLLSNSQSGFRRRLCTLDQVTRLEHHIRMALLNNHVLIVLFLDFAKAFDAVWHVGLVYKLSKMGVKGKMLRWIEEYLRNRKFRVLFEGVYSTERKMNCGVPQGSVLSPLLFNVMTSDLPKMEGVHLSEYADDIMYYTSTPTMKEAEQRMNIQMREVEEWASKWGMRIQAAKTKGMVFSRINNLNPNISIKNAKIDFVNKYKYLGLILDAPQLRWEKHIENLKLSCVPRINILKAISGQHWGADRKLLLNLYNSYVKSVIDYGNIFYSVATNKYLKSLDVIQNECLRIALGVKRTSPIVSMEAESGVPPLHISRQLSMFKYYSRINDLPDHLLVKRDTICDYYNYYQKKWSERYKAPFLIRCKKFLRRHNINKLPTTDTSLVSPLSYMIDTEKIFINEFPVSKFFPQNQITGAFKHLKDEVYTAYEEIYCDGSLVKEPCSTSAAIIVVQDNKEILTQSWKLLKQCSIFTAELFAILQAFKHIKENINISTGVVIYSDSQSSITALQNKQPKNNIPLIFQVHNLLQELLARFPIRVQYIPGHRGILGNERADEMAKAAHSKQVSILSPLTREDQYPNVKDVLWKGWDNLWRKIILNTGKGKALLECREKLGEWPWAYNKNRKLETVMAKLRIGHAGVQSYLYKIKKADSNKCNCGQTEDIDHVLLICPRYRRQRDTLKSELEILKVPFNKKNILGGGEYDLDIQKKIVELMHVYLRSIGIIDKL